MRSLRTKITLLNGVAVAVALLTATIIGVVSIANFGHESCEKELKLLSQEGRNSLNDYFDSVEQSADTISGLIEVDLKDTDLSNLSNHSQKADLFFKEAIEHTEGVATYYYRFDPDLTTEPGFWYVDEGEGLKPHSVTNITENDCPWFYGPKEDGKASWLLPYDTDSLDSYTVISYNVPVYKDTTFVGVVGIEISYKTLGEQIKDIKVLQSGYAFVVENTQGTIIFHPQIDLLGMNESARPETPQEFKKAFLRGDEHIEYTFDGVRKHCYVVPLGDDNMSVVVCVPLSEVNNVWLKVVLQLVVASLVVLAASIVITFLFSRRLTRPLKDLTVAAEEIDKGNYDVHLEYKGEDEMGVLTNTVNKLIDDLGGYINDLNTLAYADALTSVRNRSAYEVAMKEMQKRIVQDSNVEFAIALFDCDYLKDINDEYGHDKGNVYLRNACHLICRVFERSAVYRIGGDEFVVILQGPDYQDRDRLRAYFVKKSAEISAFAKEAYEKIRVSIGIAVYDPRIDKTVQDVAIHADHLMYENKRERKQNNK